MFLPTIDLSSLDGANGFRLEGIDPNDEAGRSVASAGDVNGDGIDDLIVGAPGAGPAGPNSGETYVVFGTGGGFGSTLSLSDLDGLNGFRLDGTFGGDLNDERSGFSVSSAGDVDGDGFDDLIVGAPSQRDGAAYVVFGSAGPFPPSLSLADVVGTNGFVVSGTTRFDLLGTSVSSAGDVDGDGFDDIIIGAPVDGVPFPGEARLVFGGPDGVSGSTVFEGASCCDLTGSAVASAGDINDDGYDDLVIGAPGAAPSGRTDAGESYVVFGSPDRFASRFTLSDLDGTNGFRLEGIAEGDRSGAAVAGVGDVNADGIDDVAIGAPGADPSSVSSAGETYVLFGTSDGFAATFALSDVDGTNGFRIAGFREGGLSGASLSSAGDVNADGIDDLLVGAPGTIGGASPGEAFVVFGRTDGFASTLDLAALGEGEGLVLAGGDPGDQTGRSVSSAGDLNADGIDDVVVGAPRASGTGTSYVVFGRAGPNTIVGDPDGRNVLIGTDGTDVVLGGRQQDIVRAGGGDDTVAGDAGIDRLRGEDGDDVIRGGEDDDNLYGNAGNDELLGGRGDDRIDGGEGDDLLEGGEDHDRLYGAGGADTLVGGGGNDVLGLSALVTRSGDGSADVARFGRNDGTDRIFGFEVGVDTIELTEGGTFELTRTRDDTVLLYGDTTITVFDALLTAADVTVIV